LESMTNFETLTPDLVLTLIEKALGRKCTNLCRPLNSYINRVYELELQEGQGGVIAKFYRPGRWSPAALQDEHDFLLELAGLEVPVIPPLLLRNGTTIGKHDSMHFAVFPKKSGRFLDEFTDEQWIILGRLLGRLHNVGAVRKASARQIMTPEQATRQQVDFMIKGKFIPPDLIGAYAELTDTLIKEIKPLFENSELIRIHGDCHFGNVIYRPDESYYLIDFDDMVMGPPIQDLWMLLPGYFEDVRAEIELFLEGYETFRPFDSRTLELIEPLRAMRYIHFSAWCARQALDGGFARLSPDWGTPAYWQQEIKDLQSQLGRIRQKSSQGNNWLPKGTMSDNDDLGIEKDYWDN